MRLTGAGVDAAHIYQGIITSTVFRRPGPNDLLEVIRAGDVLVVAALLERLGRDTLGLLELINRLATMGVDLKVVNGPARLSFLEAGPPPSPMQGCTASYLSGSTLKWLHRHDSIHPAPRSTLGSQVATPAPELASSESADGGHKCHLILRAMITIEAVLELRRHLQR